MSFKQHFSNTNPQTSRVGIVCSEFNKDLVTKLYEGGMKALLRQSVQIIVTEWVPGVGEIPQASRWLIEKHKLDGLLACGALIRGETLHFESLCRFLEKALLNLQIDFSIPVIFSILMLGKPPSSGKSSWGEQRSQGRGGRPDPG